MPPRNRTCRVPGCERMHRANGLCNRHYAQWYRHGGNADWIAPPRPPRDENRSLNGSSRERAEYGCIVTFENEDGKTLVLHRVGPPAKRLAEMCDCALQLDASSRVLSYSTPHTIGIDLSGTRVYVAAGMRHKPPSTPEATILTRIGRKEMLHPRLRAA